MKVFLATPPFTQINTAYPATAYLKGFLNTLDIESFQADLSLDVILNIFSKQGLEDLFTHIEQKEYELSDAAFRVFSQRKRYIQTIDPTLLFLQNKNPTLAHTISIGGYLPEAERFKEKEDMLWAFGTMGIQDKARHLATLYLEDIGDLIKESVDPYFGFSRYAERIASTATSFDTIYKKLYEEETWITNILHKKINQYLDTIKPDIICITIPFPGNVFAAFKMAKFVKEYHQDICVVMGGGYVNTELRSIYDPRVFEFVDFITLDDGEAPLQHIIEYKNNARAKSNLKRTFYLESGVVMYINGSSEFDIPQKDVGTPDYRGLRLDEYISVIELINPMHRLWSDGRWNKLTLAHGCYWGKCSFCDVTLDYIKRYEPISPSDLCDRIETIIQQTGQNGFHFVDEAAPPALMRDLAIEIIRRDITVVWWTNIRFEKSFTVDVCRLLRASGCIAVSGGLEVASDRLLALMQKGVTVAQVAKVSESFTKSDIMVHAYLMYGFPTQTAQETIDSLEMVRQLIQAEVIQSGFWHQFAMTAHSPVGLNPSSYGVVHTGPNFEGFAKNDYFHEDETGAAHEKYSDGLKHSLFNYMHGIGLDEPLHVWFDFPIPKTGIHKKYIHKSLKEETNTIYRKHDRVVWIGGEAMEMILPDEDFSSNLADTIPLVEIVFSDIRHEYSIMIDYNFGEWLLEQLEQASPKTGVKYTFAMLESSFQSTQSTNFDEFVLSEQFNNLKEKGLLIV